MRAAAATPSRRQLSRWQREQRQQRTLLALGGSLVALVVLILAVGWYVDTVVRAGDVAAVVYGGTITTSQLLDEMRPAAQAIDARARLAAGGTRNAAMAEQIEFQKRSLPDQVLNDLVDRRILEHEAARRGLAVSPEEIDARMRETVAEIEAVNAPPPASVETPPAPGAAAEPTAVPTLEPSAYQSALQGQLEQLGMSEARYRDQIAVALLNERLEAAIGADVPAVQEQVHARHILVDDEARAQDILTQLAGGADFAALAAQLSTDTATGGNGGDLGWFPRGAMVEAFESAAFSLEAGQRSGIVRSQFGYHIVEVLERDAAHPVPPDQLAGLRQQAFSRWLSSQRVSPDITLELDPAERDWTLRHLGVRP